MNVWYLHLTIHLTFWDFLYCRSWLEYRGNVIGATMYRTGRPGQTMCINEGLATSRRYPGLCGVYIEKDYNFFLAFMYSVFSYRSLVRRSRTRFSITLIWWFRFVHRDTALFRRCWLSWSNVHSPGNYTNRSVATSISSSFSCSQ